MRSFVEELREGLLLRAPHRHDIAPDETRDLRGRIIQVPDEDRLRRTDHDAGRLESHVDPVRAEVALLRRVILRVDEDRVVGARRDAGLASDAHRLVEVHDSVRPREHRRSGARSDARSMLTLVAACHLERAPRLGEDPDVHGLDVRAVDAQGDFVLRFACRAAGMAADAPRLVDDLRHPDRKDVLWSFLNHLRGF